MLLSISIYLIELYHYPTNYIKILALICIFCHFINTELHCGLQNMSYIICSSSFLTLIIWCWLFSYIELHITMAYKTLDWVNINVVIFLWIVARKILWITRTWDSWVTLLYFLPLMHFPTLFAPQVSCSWEHNIDLLYTQLCFTLMCQIKFIDWIKETVSYIKRLVDIWFM